MRRAILTVFTILGFATSAYATECGIYAGNGPTGGAGPSGVQGVAVFEKWSGLVPQRALDFADDRSPEAMTNGANWAIPAWSVTTPLTESVPLAVNGMALSDVAAGKLDAQYQVIAKLMTARNNPDDVIRVGWEANGNWYPWAAKNHEADYISAFRRVVGIFRTAGFKGRFDWTIAQGWQQVPDSTTFYPGDDDVDIIGMDVYGQSWESTPPIDWPHTQMALNHNYTLDWLPYLGRLHHKPISIPEVGTGERPDGHGLGDSAEFVNYMGAWVHDHNVAYVDWWDASPSDYNSKVSSGEHPKAGAALKAIASSVCK